MSFHVLICHYGDRFWTEAAIAFWSRIKVDALTLSFPKGSIQPEDLPALINKWQAVAGTVNLSGHVLRRTPPSHASQQHSEAISELREIAQIDSSHVIVADPDLWVVRPEVMEKELEKLGPQDALFVADHVNTTLSHACLAVMPKEFFLGLDLGEGLQSHTSDFGRQWHSQHKNKSRKDAQRLLLEPFQTNSWGGYFYPQVGAIHFSSQSFVGSKWLTPSLRPWVRWANGAPKRFAKRLLSRFEQAPGKATFFDF